MNVYVRHVDESEAQHLTECAPDGLENLMALLKERGVQYREISQPFIGWQFVLGATETYVEAIVGTP